MPSLGPNLPLSPPPYLQRGWVGPLQPSSSLEFLSPFVLQTARSVLGLVNFLSLLLSIPQFKLLSHESSDCSQGLWAPVITLSNATCSSLFHPHLVGADAGIWGTFLLGVTFSHVIMGFIYFSSQLGCPLRFKNFPQNLQWEGFLVFGNFVC